MKTLLKYLIYILPFTAVILWAALWGINRAFLEPVQEINGTVLGVDTQIRMIDGNRINEKVVDIRSTDGTTERYTVNDRGFRWKRSGTTHAILRDYTGDCISATGRGLRIGFLDRYINILTVEKLYDGECLLSGQE